MYRKRNGSLGFSWTTFVNAAVPNLFADTTPSTLSALEPFRKDILYSHQLASANFVVLDDCSVFVAGVVDTERMSKNVHKALKKSKILNDDGRVDTYKIGSNFINQIPMITTRRQKALINMLFWWEEECHRYLKLKDEDDELSRMIHDAEQSVVDDSDDDGEAESPQFSSVAKERVDQLKFARERVRMKIRQRPSQRRPDLEANTDNIMESYRGRALSAPAIANSGERDRHDSAAQVNERPPDYHVVTTVK